MFTLFNTPAGGGASPTLTSANFALGLLAKCKNCTLEEIAVLRVIQQNPSTPQKFVASEIGKSERAVKSIITRLTEQGIIRRSKGKGSPCDKDFGTTQTIIHV